MKTITFNDDKNTVTSSINLEKNIVLNNVLATEVFTVTIIDSNGITTTTEFVGGRPNDRR